MNKIDYRVYLVTDDPSRYERPWLDQIVAAVEGGVTCVQYRDTESSSHERYSRILRLKDALSPRQVPLIVNNDVELAQAVKAEGVHVGRSDMSPEQVRKLVGASVEIGLSVTGLSDVTDALAQVEAGNVDVLGIGPVFDARKTKADASDAMGLETLAEVVRLTPGIPNCAIGGITCENAASVIASGAGGLAVVSAFSRAEDPFAVARFLKGLYK